MIIWSAPWRRLAASALLLGTVGAALTSCASGKQKAEDEAVTDIKSQLSKLEDTAKYFLRTSPDRDHARQEFAANQGPYVYGSSINGNIVTWSIALVGQGGFSTSGTSTVTRLRTCMQMHSSTALDLSLTTVPCPADFKNSPGFLSYNREIDILKK